MKKIIVAIMLMVLINLYNPALARTVKVKQSTRIPVTLSSQATSKNVLAGEKIDAIITENIYINKVLVFKKGDRAYLNISDVKKAGFLGNPGKLQIVNGKVFDINGTEHMSEFNQNFTGEEKTYPKVLLGVSIFFLFPLALFAFVKGGQASINTGHILDLYLMNDFDFSENAL